MTALPVVDIIHLIKIGVVIGGIAGLILGGFIGIVLGYHAGKDQ